MHTVKNIIEEVQSFPENQLDELFQVISSMNLQERKSEARRKKILSYSGCFKDLSEDEYSSLKKELKKTRKSLLTRHVVI